MQPLRLAVVTRERRVGAWVTAQARRRDGIEVVVPPAEAFVLVTPADEVPADLLEEILLERAEWRARPVAFVSYGSGAGAAERLRSVFSELHVVMVGSYDCSATAVMFEQLEWWGRALRDRRAS